MSTEASHVPTLPHSTTPEQPVSSRESKALVAENQARSRISTNVRYLLNPSSSHTPARLRTRALLRALHYIGVFVYWRAVRWAKYAIVGSVIAALSSVAFAGSIASGVGLFVAPPGIVASIAVGSVWGLARWAWRRRQVKKGRVKPDGQPLPDHDPRVHPRVAAKEPDLVPW